MTERELGALLDRFAASVDDVWAAYGACGPGRVDPALFDPVRELGAALDDAAPESIRETIATARDLAERCACTSLGLNFVSGEAGLIPRKDQHDAMARALDDLRALASKLRS